MLYAYKGHYGLTNKALRKMLPGVSLPKSGQVNYPGVVCYERAPQPKHNNLTQGVREMEPINGVQQWEVYPLPEDEADAKAKAHTRDFIKQCADQAQDMLDRFAQERTYAGILSLCSYVNSKNERFAAEAARAVEVRDQTWTALYQYLDEVEAGDRPKPSSVQEVMDELPPMIWGDL